MQYEATYSDCHGLTTSMRDDIGLWATWNTFTLVEAYADLKILVGSNC